MVNINASPGKNGIKKEAMIRPVSAKMIKNKKIIDAGYNLIHIWECEWTEEKRNEEVVNILEQIDYLTPLQIRDAFFGGRTDTLKTFMDIEKFWNGLVHRVDF